MSELGRGPLLVPVAHLRLIGSPYGHDGFLIETEQVASLVRELLHKRSASRHTTLTGCRTTASNR
ncbi:hypothetical protein ACIRP7_20345 [Streptomyces sp. NPDC102270]|uniref:hypothetical protein n=1 Tax=Streptomyces sp. NPDC102270 TaxID=3366150 RepID=UPI0037F66C2D